MIAQDLPTLSGKAPCAGAAGQMLPTDMGEFSLLHLNRGHRGPRFGVTMRCGSLVDAASGEPVRRLPRRCLILAMS